MNVVCFLLGNSPASEVYMPTFRNTVGKRKPFSRMISQHISNLVRSTHIYLPMKMEQTECSETLAHKLQTPGNYPEESIQHRFMWLIARTSVRSLSSYLVCFSYRYLKRNSPPLCPFHVGFIVAGDWSASDRECMASSEGFHKADCLSTISRRQNYCRLSPLFAGKHKV